MRTAGRSPSLICPSKKYFKPLCCSLCQFCNRSCSKDNAKGWLPSWIRHRLVDTWSNNYANPCVVFVSFAQSAPEPVHQLPRKPVMQRRTTGQHGFIAFQSMRTEFMFGARSNKCCLECFFNKSLASIETVASNSFQHHNINML